MPNPTPLDDKEYYKLRLEHYKWDQGNYWTIARIFLVVNAALIGSFYAITVERTGIQHGLTELGKLSFVQVVDLGMALIIWFLGLYASLTFARLLRVTSKWIDNSAQVLERMEDEGVLGTNEHIIDDTHLRALPSKRRIMRPLAWFLVLIWIVFGIGQLAHLMFS